MFGMYTLEQQQLVGVLTDNPYVVIDMEDEDGVMHYYTLGLCRFGIPELYACGPATPPKRGNHEDDDPLRRMLWDMAPTHMVQRFVDGPLTFPELQHSETGEVIAAEARYLRGAELYTVAGRLYDSYKKNFGWELNAIFTTGICQILWPDDDNLAFTALSPYGEGATQVISPTVVH